MESYYSGVIDCTGKEVDWDALACAANLSLAGMSKGVFSRAAFHDGKMQVAFALSGDVAIGRLKEMFAGFSVSYRKLVPLASAPVATKVIARVANADPKDRVSACDLEPCGKADLAPADAPIIIGREAQLSLMREITETVSRFGRRSLESLSMAFLGAPGTGKTMMAKSLLKSFEAALGDEEFAAAEARTIGFVA